MGTDFSADEVLQVAEQIERNGADFYTRASGCMPDAESKEMLLGLADMEKGHEKIFANMRKTLEENEKEATVFDPDSQAALYLAAFAGGFVFNPRENPCDKLDGCKSVKDVLRIAIGLERDSIAFYVGIADMVSKKLGKARVEEIIKEEKGHVILLSEKLASLA
jgi:rubrerythrin